MKRLIPVFAAVMAAALVASGAAWAYDSGNVLSNGGFETGDLSEKANNAAGPLPWMSGNTKNAIGVSKANPHAGEYSLEWKPIGWNVKDDGALEDASTFMLTKAGIHAGAGATEVVLRGWVNVSALADDKQFVVVLANGTFSTVKFDIAAAGGTEGWQQFEQRMAINKSDDTVIAAFSIGGTKGVGAPGSVVYLDDLELVFRGEGKEKPAPAPAKEETPPAAVANSNDAETRPFRMGFTPFAWDLDENAARTSLEFVNKFGDIVCHHFDGGVPWVEALEDKPFPAEMQKDWDRRVAGAQPRVKVYLAVTPLNNVRTGMALNRGESENQPIPEAFKDKPFNDPDVKKAYLNYCRRAAEQFKPDYFAIGIEVNELLHGTPDMWDDFVELHKFVYGEIKKIYPDMPVFASLTLHNMIKNLPNSDKQREQIKAFLPLNDLAGVSFYPFFTCLGPVERPAESFEWVRELTGDMPLAIAETAYPAEPTKVAWGEEEFALPGTPEKQQAYYETLLKAATEDDYLFVITFLYRDYDRLWDDIKANTPSWASAWKDTGLLDGDGQSRPAWRTWETYRARPYRRGE